MKFSNHTILVEDYPAKDEFLAYSTRTQAMVKLDRQLKETIDHLNGDLSLLEETQQNNIRALHRMGILVESEAEEQQKIQQHMGQLKFGVQKKSLPITILTTYACNLKCVYCFQESSRTNEKMSADTSDQAMDWIKARLLKQGYDELYLVFYGGEPLVNKPILERVAAEMKLWCESHKIQFKFMLQTNGYLMRPELIRQYIKLGLAQVRISVDGVGEDHDKNRPLRKGGGTFDVIMKNIVDCCDLIPIGISVSYDKGEISHIKRLLDYFDAQGILQKLGRFIYSPVHATLGPKGESEKIVGSSCMCNYEDQSLVDANIRIREMMAEKNLPMKSGMSTSVCPVTRDNAGVTIDQHGAIYKCNSMLGHPEYSTGHVKDNDYNEVHRQFVGLDVWRQCPVDCTYLPMCSGGCRLSAFLKNQNFKAPSCHKPYLNKMAPQFVKEEYEALVAKKAAVPASVSP